MTTLRITSSECSRVVTFGVVLFTTLLACGKASAQAAPNWRVGVASAKITPQQPLWMTGYAVRDRPSDGTSQDLWVKVLAFEDPHGKRGVLLTLDLCGIPRSVSDRVAQKLGQRQKILRSAVMTNVSHTHCSPAVTGYLSGLRVLPPDGAKRRDGYTDELVEIMVTTAESALQKLAVATITWSQDEATFGINRRNNIEKDAPGLRAAGTLKGPSDPRVPILAVHGSNGELSALLISYACHNTTLMLSQWHGDYAGCAQRELERRYPGATVLFVSGCGADINPNPRREIALAEQHGVALADAADRAMKKPRHMLSGALDTRFSDITLTFSRKPTNAEIREAREKEQPNKEMHQAWAAAVEERLSTLGDDALRYEYPIQTWKLGNLTWVALGGEVVVDYSLRMKKELGENLWVFGYSTDVMAYIPSERVLREGGYEGNTSMVPYGLPGPWTPGLEEKIIGKTRQLLDESN